MTITDAGKKVFLGAMSRSGKPVVNMFLHDEGDGRVGLNLGLIEEAGAKRLIEVNGIKIDINEEDEAFMEKAVFDAEGDNLKVTMPMRGCGCCHGHHHDDCDCDHEHCDCDHDHCDCDHEDGCCDDGCCHHEA